MFCSFLTSCIVLREKMYKTWTPTCKLICSLNLSVACTFEIRSYKKRRGTAVVSVRGFLLTKLSGINPLMLKVKTGSTHVNMLATRKYFKCPPTDHGPWQNTLPVFYQHYLLRPIWGHVMWSIRWDGQIMALFLSRHDVKWAPIKSYATYFFLQLTGFEYQIKPGDVGLGV